MPSILGMGRMGRAMALRFRRSVRLMPGVRVNFSGGGISVTAGIRASITAGRRGVYSNVGIPGMGLSSRTRLDSPKLVGPGGSRARPGPMVETEPAPQSVGIVLRLQDTGDVIVERENGSRCSRTFQCVGSPAGKKQSGSAPRDQARGHLRRQVAPAHRSGPRQ